MDSRNIERWGHCDEPGCDMGSFVYFCPKCQRRNRDFDNWGYSDIAVAKCEFCNTLFLLDLDEDEIMIDPKTLTEKDIGRKVTYNREFCKIEHGELSSWNDTTIFVRFKGPNGEGCEPQDVSFDFPNGVT